MGRKRTAKIRPAIKHFSEMTRPELTWVTVGDGTSLHAPALNSYETEMLSTRGIYLGGEVLCDQAVLTEMSLPGPRSARLAARCARCCRATGFPTGAGSPEFDAAIRKLIGLDATPLDAEWSARITAARDLCVEWLSKSWDSDSDEYTIGRADMAGAILRLLDASAAEQPELRAS